MLPDAVTPIPRPGKGGQLLSPVELKVMKGIEIMLTLSPRRFLPFSLIVLPGLIVLLVDGVHGDPRAPENASTGGVEIKVIKYDELVKQVKSHQGKVVVVDVWGPSCPSCMQEFPNLIRLNQEYKSRGLDCISVAVALTDKDSAETSLPFLRKMKATFPNFWLNESIETWTAKWSTSSIPMVFVFDRQGKRVGKWGHDVEKGVDYKGEIEPLVKKLLEEKP